MEISVSLDTWVATSLFWVEISVSLDTWVRVPSIFSVAFYMASYVFRSWLVFEVAKLAH